MSLRTTPPFRADHVGSLLRPPELLRRARRLRRRAHRRRCAARRRGCGDHGRRQAAGGRRPAGGHRRRVPPRVVAHGLHLPARRHPRGRRAHARAVPQRGRRHRVQPGQARVYDTVTLPKTIFGEHFTYLKSQVTTRRAEADDPVAEHGPLPQRPAVHRHRRVPGHGRVLERRQRRLRAGGRAAARARLHATCRWTTRASPT